MMTHFIINDETDESFHKKLRFSTRYQDLSGFSIRFLVFLLVIEYTLKVLSVLSNVVIENWGPLCKVGNPLATLIIARVIYLSFLATKTHFLERFLILLRKKYGQCITVFTE